jgi:kynureninase
MTNPSIERVRSRFLLPTDKVYLDGNSLGPLTSEASEHLIEAISQQWGQDLVAAWNKHGWIDLPQTVGNQIAPIIGAHRGNVICCDSLSVNLFKALSAALEINSTRTRITVEAHQFPTDNYIASGLARLMGPDRCQINAIDISKLTTDDLSDTAVLALSHVDYKTGTLRDMPGITALAQEAGALIVWDLAHSAGVVDLSLESSNVDFAVGCTYKFLNGGPGAPGFLFARAQHQSAQNPIPGWMGHARIFDFEPEYEPAKGIQRFLTGTQSVIALSAVAGALTLFEDVKVRDLREASLSLTRAFIERWKRSPLSTVSVLLTPENDRQRGSHVSLALDDAFPISQALIDDGIIIDYREPNIVRFGFAPLYNTDADTERAMSALEAIVASKRYEAPKYQVKSTVT